MSTALHQGLLDSLSNRVTFPSLLMINNNNNKIGQNATTPLPWSLQKHPRTCRLLRKEAKFKREFGTRTMACGYEPMRATCPGRLSVGTRVCETPNAPLVSAMERRYGATTSGASGRDGNALRLKRRSARSPSPRKEEESQTVLVNTLKIACLYAPTMSTRRFDSASPTLWLGMPWTTGLLK